MVGTDFVYAPVRRWLIAVDDSGIEGGSSFYGFGTLWMPWQRRGDFQELIRGLRARHRYTSLELSVRETQLGKELRLTAST